jgi:hypothetical protein
MTAAAALLALVRRGWVPFLAEGQVRFRAPAGDKNTPEAAEAVAVLRAHREEAAALLAWPRESWEAAARFGHADALLYPLIGAEVDTPAGPVVLRQVLGGWAVVLRPGAERVERLRVADVRPREGGVQRAG